MHECAGNTSASNASVRIVDPGRGRNTAVSFRLRKTARPFIEEYNFAKHIPIKCNFHVELSVDYISFLDRATLDSMQYLFIFFDFLINRFLSLDPLLSRN